MKDTPSRLGVPDAMHRVRCQTLVIRYAPP